MLNWIWDRFTARERNPDAGTEYRVDLLDGTSEIVSKAVFEWIESDEKLINKLQQQLAHKTDLEAAQKTAYERESARASELELLSNRQRESIVNLDRKMAEFEHFIAQQDDMIGNLYEDNEQLTASRDSWRTLVNESHKQLAAIDAILHPDVQIGPRTMVEIDESQPVSESPIGDSVGEETAVIDRAAVMLPAGVVDSAPYGEA